MQKYTVKMMLRKTFSETNQKENMFKQKIPIQFARALRNVLKLKGHDYATLAAPRI